ncbi:aspartate/glutamate racemase family protein [Pseudomonas chlororaphis]|uniref:arylsulfatase n=1 Tax=Pseudomonas chlororaphis TaxID=587753 RepID=UPI000565A3AB|nr:arylsulfatase [Pseudomonas chlororaphis]
MKAPRIFLIHATALAIDPIATAFARHWPQAQVINLLEDSLSRDRVEEGELTASMKARFLTLSHYAVQSAADAILFTCSAFGDAIDLCKPEIAIPLLKPNEAMINLALTQASRIAVLATFEPTIVSIMAEFRQAAERSGRALELVPYFVPGAMQALSEGDKEGHDRAIVQMATQVDACDLICFAQFSMTSAAGQAQARSGLPVLTTPDSAVLEMRRMLQADDFISSQDGCLPHAQVQCSSRFPVQ